LALFCPITSNVKGYPFEVVLPEKQKVSGAILSDQIKSLDWQVRKAKWITSATKDVIEEVLAKIHVLLGFESRQIDTPSSNIASPLHLNLTGSLFVQIIAIPVSSVKAQS